MTPARVARRPQATRDIRDAARYYLREGGPALAQRFVESVEAELAHIARHPDTGSRRYATAGLLNDLRFGRPRKFPYLIFYFYFEAASRVEIVRVLHASRDIPASMRDDESEQPPRA